MVHRFLTLAALLVAGGAPWAADESPVDLDAVLAEAQAVQERDLVAWTRYAFKREVVRRSLDADDEEKSREVLVFVVQPIPYDAGFDETLLRIDGRIPSSRQQRKHRDAARFTKHYLQAVHQGEAVDNEANPILHLWDAENYIYGGREVVQGVTCHRIEDGPSPEPEDGGVKARLAAANTGTLWIAVDGLQIVQSETRIARDVKLPMGLGRLKRFEVRLATTRLDDGTRLPGEIEVASEVSVLGKAIRKRNEYRYSGFKPK